LRHAAPRERDRHEASLLEGVYGALGIADGLLVAAKLDPA